MNLPAGQTRYSEAFQRKVIEEYLSTHCMKKYLMRKYQIGGKSPLQQWMQKLGYQDPDARSKSGKKFKFEGITPIGMPSTSSPGAGEDPQVLQKKIDALQRQLQEEKLRSEAYLRIIEKAEKELNLSIRKKPFAR